MTIKTGEIGSFTKIRKIVTSPNAGKTNIGMARLCVHVPARTVQELVAQCESMKSLAVRNYCKILLVVVAFAFASPATAQPQGMGARQPLNQLPPIVSPDGAPADHFQKKQLFLPPIVPGNGGIANQLPPTVFGKPASAPNLPPIVQGNSQSTTAPVAARPMLPQVQSPIQMPIKRVSTAGVPLYPGGHGGVSNADFNGQPGTDVGQVGFNGFPQGSGTRNIAPPGNLSNPLPPIVSPGSLSPTFDSSLVPDMSGALAPTTQSPLSRDPFLGSPSVVEPSFSQGSGTRNIATPAPALPIPQGSGTRNVPTDPGNTFFSNPAPPAAPFASNAPIASNGPIADTGCASCGNGGCYNLDQVQSQFGCCGSVVSAGYYGFIDGLVWTRGDGDIQFSNFFGLNDFSFEGGLRLTFGYRQNATEGREFTYFGIGDLDENQVSTSGTNSLAPIFTVSTAFGLGPVNGFTTASLHDHSKSSSIHSLEYSRVKWNWDVVKTMIGLRYIYFDDSTSFFSTNSLAGQNALYTQDAVNNLFGVNAGFELFYDVGFRTSFSAGAKGGAFLNIGNVDTNLFNFGTQALTQDVDDATIASTIEVNALSHFQLRPQTRFRLGYDLLFLWGAYTVDNNSPRLAVPLLSPLTGTDLNTNNDVVFFHGLSFGFEFYR